MPQPTYTTTKRTYVQPTQQPDPLVGDGQYSNKMVLFPFSGLAPPPTARELTGHPVPPADHRRRSSRDYDNHNHRTHHYQPSSTHSHHHHSRPHAYSHNDHHDTARTVRREHVHAKEKTYHSDETRRRSADVPRHHRHGHDEVKRTVVVEPVSSRSSGGGSGRSSGEEVRRVGTGKPTRNYAQGYQEKGRGEGRRVVVEKYVR